MKRNSLPNRTSISPFMVMEVLEKAQGMEALGHDIIHMEVGEPDFPTPEPVKEAAFRALQADDTHYTHSLGKLALREAIAAHYWRKYGVKISPEQVLVTSGTSPGMLLVFSVLMEAGEEVIIPDPYYSCYPNFIRYLGGNPILVPVKETDGFKYRPAEVGQVITRQTSALVVNSPANPTGAVYSGGEMAALAEIGPTIISDEIYNGLIYEGEEHSILEYTDKAFVINGFSKLYAMTGWRLGYVIAPQKYIRPLQKMQQNLFICASSFVQEGGIAALQECQTEVEQMVRIYDERRRFLLKRLKEMGIATTVDPAGAFYALANVERYTRNSYEFAFQILEQAKVAVTPGIDFGPHCEGYIRLSYCNSLENIAEGLRRLEAFFQKL